MNGRGAVRATQRAGQKKRQGKRVAGQISSGVSSESDTIEVEGRPAIRQRTSSNSPSIRAAVRGGRRRRGTVRAGHSGGRQ